MEILRLFFACIFLETLYTVSSTKPLNARDIKICTKAHNMLRRLHNSTSDLVWDEILALNAQHYAERLVRLNKKSTKNRLIHEVPTRGMGESLFWQDNKMKGTCADASLSWYSEIKDYSYQTSRSKNGYSIGHFTQLVWKETTKFGVGIATMKSRKYSKYGNIETFVVAKYLPRGNFYYKGKRLTTYTENVRPRIPGAKTPELKDFDPAIKHKCENSLGDSKCKQMIVEYGYSCESRELKTFFKQNCYKKCKYC